MPELPEVTTTVSGLKSVLIGLKITSVWSDYFLRTKNRNGDSIKNKKYFERLKKEVVGERIENIERKGKNILIRLSNNKTVLVHMKMTGHFLYGKYKKTSGWTALESEKLRDPFNRFIHLVFTLSNGFHLAFSDMRKFAKIMFFETDKQNKIADLNLLGPDPLDELTPKSLAALLGKKPNGKIKTVLMDQSILAGIGNIYSDEILWEAGVHPEKISSKISRVEAGRIFKSIKKILTKAIAMGGDSMSDYRNIHGERGGFQNFHKAYRRTRQKCLRPGCNGTIARKIINGRSAHFCNKHQR